MAEEGVVSEIVSIDISDPEAAKRERCLGSPSIQINGLDIEEDRRAEPACYGCRMYPGGKPSPSKEMIRAALRRTLTPKLKVLFLCTGNSCRSQMAEGWARALKGDRIEAYSAGIETHGLNPNAVKAMAEAGIDITGHRSKHVDEVMGVGLDCVVTVCGHAHEACPMFPGETRVVHVGFDDPPKLAASAATEEEALNHYRRVRDDIRAFVALLPDALG